MAFDAVLIRRDLEEWVDNFYSLDKDFLMEVLFFKSESTTDLLNCMTERSSEFNPLTDLLEKEFKDLISFGGL
jgi:hypothetical protein